jgi:hypothetical protein
MLAAFVESLKSSSNDDYEKYHDNNYLIRSVAQ